MLRGRSVRTRSLPAGAGRDSRIPRGLPVPRPARPGHLRRQGEIAPAAAQSVLRRLRQPAPAHPDDAPDRRRRRVDRGRHRGRGLAAGVLLDQGVRPQVQHQVPGRQELPLPGRHHGGGVPAGHGHARCQAEGHQVLRPVQPRLGHPRHGGHAAARIPGPHLLGGGVQAVRPDRPPLPARLHRQVLGAVRQAGQRRGAPPAGRGLLRLHGRADQPVRRPPRGRDEAGRARGGVRARRAAPRRPAGP